MNGETKVAPALAASSAWVGEKHSVTLVLISSSAKAAQAIRPSRVRGIFTTTFGAIAASFLPSAIMASAVVAATSALIGPGTMSQISAITSSMGRPDLAIRVGLVVTPSIRPVEARSAMTLVSVLSRKICMVARAGFSGGPRPVLSRAGGGPQPLDGQTGSDQP